MEYLSLENISIIIIIIIESLVFEFSNKVLMVVW